MLLGRVRLAGKHCLRYAVGCCTRKSNVDVALGFGVEIIHANGSRAARVQSKGARPDRDIVREDVPSKDHNINLNISYQVARRLILFLCVWCAGARTSTS